MANKLQSLAKDTAIYGLSSIVGRFLNYLLVPLYTYKIAAASGGYGVISNIYSYTALLLVILTFGMETTFFRFANNDSNDPRRVLSTTLYSVGGVALAFLFFVFVFLKPISASLGYAAHSDYIAVMAVVVALDAFQAILFAYLRFRHRPIKFLVLKLSFVVANIALNLFVFLLAPVLAEKFPALMGWYSQEDLIGYVFIVNLICTSLITFGFIPELKNLRFGFDTRMLKKMLGYTWPLLLFGIVGILNQVADKILYPHLVPGQEGEVQLGIYSACAKIATIMMMLTQAFRYAYEPLVFGIKKNSQSGEVQAKAMKYFIIFALLAFLAVMAFIDVLKFIIDSCYWEGLAIVPIVMLADICIGIYFNLSFWYKLSDRTWWGAVFSGIGAVVLISINVVFVPKYGYVACAWGGLIGNAVCVLLSFLVGQRKQPVAYPLGDIFIYVLCFALAWVFMWLVGLLGLGTVLVLIARMLILFGFVAVIVIRDIPLKTIVSSVESITSKLKHRK